MKKSPIKHKVKSHKREGKTVQSFTRGKGSKTKISKPTIRKKSKKLKVYGIIDMVRKEDRDDQFYKDFPWRVQARYVAAVFSAKEFADLLGASVGYVRNYGSVTGNKKEIELAMDKPHTLIFMKGV